MDCALVLCLLLGEDFFSALHIFYVGSPLLKKHTWLLFGLHFPEWWIWEKRQPPFTLGLESVSLLQIAHILWSLFYSVAPWGAGLQVVRTAGNWKSQCLVYSRSRSAVITDLSYVPAKSLQSFSTLWDPMDCSLPGFSVHGILQARTLEWVAISFSSAWKWKVKVKSLSHVWLLATPWTAAHQAPPSMGFSGQQYWSGVPLPSPKLCTWYLLYQWKCSSSLWHLGLSLSWLQTRERRSVFGFFFSIFFFLPHSVWDLRFPTRDWTRAFYTGSMESQPLDSQGSPRSVFVVALFT